MNAVAYSPAGTTVAVGDLDGSTYLWDTATGKVTATLTDPGNNADVNAVAFSPAGTTLAAGDHDGSTYLWDVATRKISATLADPGSEDVMSVAFGPGGTTLAAADANGRAYLWKVATGKLTATFSRDVGAERELGGVRPRWHDPGHGKRRRQHRPLADQEWQGLIVVSSPLLRILRFSKRPVWYASTTAWTRSRRRSFCRMCVTCVLTVVSLM